LHVQVKQAGAQVRAGLVRRRTAPRITTPLLRQIAVILGQDYEPGTIERGLFDMLGSQESVNISAGQRGE
jgi:hypothetical protein